jgi:hypothetical protein
MLEICHILTKPGDTLGRRENGGGSGKKDSAVRQRLFYILWVNFHLKAQGPEFLEILPFLVLKYDQK